MRITKISACILFVILVALPIVQVRAEGAPPSQGDAAPGGKPGKRQKTLEFDEGLVEGVNKRPLDFSSKATGFRNKRKQHLYRKEISFEKDLDETVREMRYAQ